MGAIQTVVRSARDADAGAVIDLLRAESLETGFDPREFVVAEEDGRVVACARLRTFPSGAHELASVAVVPDRRGSRVGAAVARAALERANGVVYALALAPGFFRRLGFVDMLVLPPEIEAKAKGECASRGFVAMRWTPDAKAAVAEIQRRYTHAAQTSSCCSGGDCCESGSYSSGELASLPQGAYLQLGTGNPVRAADLKKGEVVLDLGSGGGVDVLLAAQAVGPRGRAIGVDFTPEMVRKARENVRASGATNVEIVEAPIEDVPLPDASVDVVISNCVVNLSLDKPAVLRGALRVLKPGGRFVVSDTLRLEGVAPSAVPSCDCTTGALSAEEWTKELAAAGFVDVRVVPGPVRGSVGSAMVHGRRPA